MACRAVAALQSPDTGTEQLQAPRRLFFEQDGSDDCCWLTIDIGDNLESIRDLENGHLVIVEGGDIRDTHLCQTSKTIVEMPFRVKEIVLEAGSSSDLLLLTSIPRLNITPAFPGSSGVIGRQCALINSGGVMVAEGLVGWAA